MISPTFAACIVCAFLVLFGIALPILNVKMGDFVSYRWHVVVVILALMIAAVVDFHDLPAPARQVVLVGGMIVACLYVLLRTLEKAMAKGWRIHGKIRHGDTEAELSTSKKDAEKGGDDASRH